MGDDSNSSQVARRQLFIRHEEHLVDVLAFGELVDVAAEGRHAGRGQESRVGNQ